MFLTCCKRGFLERRHNHIDIVWHKYLLTLASCKRQILCTLFLFAWSILQVSVTQTQPKVIRKGLAVSFLKTGHIFNWCLESIHLTAHHFRKFLLSSLFFWKQVSTFFCFFLNKFILSNNRALPVNLWSRHQTFAPLKLVLPANPAPMSSCQ